MSTQGPTRARDDHTSQAPPASRATRASSTCSRPRPPIPVPWEARGAAPCPPTSQNHPPTCRDDLAEAEDLCPNSRINSGNGSGANGFRLQPEELEVGTKLLIFVYLIKSVTHWPKVKQKQPERDHNMYPQAETKAESVDIKQDANTLSCVGGPSTGPQQGPQHTARRKESTAPRKHGALSCALSVAARCTIQRGLGVALLRGALGVP